MATVLVLLMMLIIASCGNKSSKNDSSAEKLTSFSEPQLYSGKIELDSSKNVVLNITLSANAKQITEIKLTAERLYLMPENISKKQSDANADNSKNLGFVYLEDAKMQTFMAIKTEDGYNVMATDEQGRTILGHLEFSGGFASKNAADVNNGKLLLAEAPLICDLALTNSRIYGTVKVEMQSGGTKTADVELKNITAN